mmetsp:Transcript_18064/g.63926  ORF Transcript_18064/g.63926 Transcript_18064/m.63926 type:complete len:505 (-) Transcript_18064:156-1670(-)
MRRERALRRPRATQPVVDELLLRAVFVDADAALAQAKRLRLRRRAAEERRVARHARAVHTRLKGVIALDVDCQQVADARRHALTLDAPRALVGVGRRRRCGAMRQRVVQQRQCHRRSQPLPLHRLQNRVHVQLAEGREAHHASRRHRRLGARERLAVVVAEEPPPVDVVGRRDRVAAQRGRHAGHAQRCTHAAGVADHAREVHHVVPRVQQLAVARRVAVCRVRPLVRQRHAAVGLLDGQRRQRHSPARDERSQHVVAQPLVLLVVAPLHEHVDGGRRGSGGRRDGVHVGDERRGSALGSRQRRRRRHGFVDQQRCAATRQRGRRVRQVRAAVGGHDDAHAAVAGAGAASTTADRESPVPLPLARLLLRALAIHTIQLGRQRRAPHHSASRPVQRASLRDVVLVAASCASLAAVVRSAAAATAAGRLIEQQQRVGLNAARRREEGRDARAGRRDVHCERDADPRALQRRPVHLTGVMTKPKYDGGRHGSPQGRRPCSSANGRRR